MTKSILYSKTVWVALLILVASILNLTGIVNLDLSADASWIGIALAVIQFILRLLTKDPVILKNKDANILSSLLIMTFLAGCCSNSIQKDVVQNKTITMEVPAQNYSLSAEYQQLPSADYEILEAAFKQLPESTYISASNDKAEIKYFPKKKSLIWQSNRQKLTPQYPTRYIRQFNRQKVLLS